MPRFLDANLMQEGEALATMRVQAAKCVRRYATDEADAIMLIAATGLDVQEDDESNVPLAAGFEDKNIASRRNRANAPSNRPARR